MNNTNRNMQRNNKPMIEINQINKERPIRDLAQIKKMEIELLHAVTKFCEEHGLRYYLAFGTLLGAVRHQGFIPWDDDIDICMPRMDYEKLLNMLAENGLDENKKLVYWENADSTYYKLYAKIYDNRTYAIDKKLGVINYGLWLDIYPIDGISSEPSRQRMYLRRYFFYQKLRSKALRIDVPGRTWKTELMNKLIRPIARWIGYERLTRTLENGLKQQEFDQSQYVLCLSPSSPSMKQKMLRTIFEDEGNSFVEFEGEFYHAPKDYDRYLQIIYGEYMVLPPKEQQMPHIDMELYWR